MLTNKSTEKIIQQLLLYIYITLCVYVLTMDVDEHKKNEKNPCEMERFSRCRKQHK